MNKIIEIPLITADGAAFLKKNYKEADIFEKQCDDNEKFWEKLLQQPNFHGCELVLEDTKRRIILSPSFKPGSLWRISYFYVSVKTNILYATMHTEMETVKIAVDVLSKECAGLGKGIRGIRIANYE